MSCVISEDSTRFRDFVAYGWVHSWLGGTQVESGGAPRSLGYWDGNLRDQSDCVASLTHKVEIVQIIPAIPSYCAKWRGQCLAEPRQIGNLIEDHSC